MFVDTFVLISRRECFLVNFIMSLRNIACITMKGVFSLPSLFSYIVFNQGPVSSDPDAGSSSDLQNLLDHGLKFPFLRD